MENIFNNQQLVEFLIKREKQTNNNSIMAFLKSLLDESNIVINTIGELPTYLQHNHADISNVLLKTFDKATLPNEKLFLLECLTINDYRGVVPIILKEYVELSNEIYRWNLGDLLYRNADKRYVKEYIDIINEKSYGSDRQMIVLLLGKIKLDETVPLLIELLDDKTVFGHALTALSEFNNPELRMYFERFKDCNIKWIQQVALRKLKKFK